MVDFHKVKCSRCNVALKGPADPKPDDTFTCPVCGESDTFEAVMETVKEYVADVTKKGVHDKMIGAFDGIKGVTVKSQEPPKKDYKFIIDFTF